MPLVKLYWVMVGILLALQVNNWNQKKINENTTLSKLNLVHKELLDDIQSLEKEIENRTKKHQLMSRALQIIEKETFLSNYNRQVLDSAFLRYVRLEPLFNNTRTYEVFLSTDSDIVNDDVYLNLNKYLDYYKEVNARVERFSTVINSINFNILMNTSVKRKSSGEFQYSFKTIQQEITLYEIIRNSKQLFEAVVSHYSHVLKQARKLELKMKANIELNEKNESTTSI